MEDHDDEPDDVAETCEISDCQKFALYALKLLEHPSFDPVKGSGLHQTAVEQANLLLAIADRSEACSDADEFDVLHHLICCQADGLARTMSKL
jgi:hypothetical protein